MTSEAMDLAPGMLALPAKPSDWDVGVFLAAVLKDKGNRQQWILARQIADEYGLSGSQTHKVAAFLRVNCKAGRGRDAHVRVTDRRKIRVSGVPVTEYRVEPLYTYAKKRNWP